jgi:hypothetical protein
LLNFNREEPIMSDRNREEVGRILMRIRSTFLGLAALFTAGAAHAVIPTYPAPGVVNPTSYNFVAASTGAITAYFAGSSASLTSEIGLSVNGGAVGTFCLLSSATALGTACNLGNATIGDSLNFVLKVSNGDFWNSKTALNTDGVNHIYSVGYSDGDFGIPNGRYIGFEDLRGGGDLDYNDHQFVVTNAAVPEPASWAMLLTGFGLVGFAARRRRMTAVAA